MKSLIPSILIGSLAVSSNLCAAIVVTGTGSVANPSPLAASISSTDLIQASSSTLASAPTFSTAPDDTGNSNNGAYGGAGTISDLTFWSSAAGGDVFSITYDLDVSTNTFGYDIAEIQTIQGFSGNNDSNQQNQNYEVFVSTVGSAAFTSLQSVAYNIFIGPTNNGSTQVNITEDVTGVLATGVDAIRFTYTIPTVNPIDGSALGALPSPAIREIDVFGTVAVPEPSSSALLGLAGIGLILRRRN